MRKAMSKIRLQAWPAWMWKYLGVSGNERQGLVKLQWDRVEHRGEARRKKNILKFFTEYWGISALVTKEELTFWQVMSDTMPLRNVLSLLI